MPLKECNLVIVRFLIKEIDMKKHTEKREPKKEERKESKMPAAKQKAWEKKGK